MPLADVPSKGKLLDTRNPGSACHCVFHWVISDLCGNLFPCRSNNSASASEPLAPNLPTSKRYFAP